METSSLVPGFRFTAGSRGSTPSILRPISTKTASAVTDHDGALDSLATGAVRLFELGQDVAEGIVICGHLGRVRNVGLGHAEKPELFYCVTKFDKLRIPQMRRSPAGQIQPGNFPFQKREKIIANPRGASALKRSASAKCPFARANIAPCQSAESAGVSGEPVESAEAQVGLGWGREGPEDGEEGRGQGQADHNRLKPVPPKDALLWSRLVIGVSIDCGTSATRSRYWAHGFTPCQRASTVL